jgi:hypothetical protein
LQIDDPGLPDWWDMLKPEPSVEAYRQFARLRIAAVNHALAGIPEESVRYHLCWGSWHGPHTHDLPLEHIIDLILEVKAQTYSFEAANVRHEHEWRVWQNAKVPPGKMLMPGVVSDATNLVEHPQLVADRILRYAAIVGRENIVAGTDCGLSGRVQRRPRLGQIAHPRRRGAPRFTVALALVEHRTDLRNTQVLGLSGRRSDIYWQFERSNSDEQAAKYRPSAGKAPLPDETRRTASLPCGRLAGHTGQRKWLLVSLSTIGHDAPRGGGT